MALVELKYVSTTPMVWCVMIVGMRLMLLSSADSWEWEHQVSIAPLPKF